MDWLPAIICASLGSAGLFGFLEYLIQRHDKKSSPIANVEHMVESLIANDARQELRMTRMELLNQIKLDPDNKQAILEIAHQYFNELNGDLYMHDMFEKWAKAKRVSTAALFAKKGEKDA